MDVWQSRAGTLPEKCRHPHTSSLVRPDAATLNSHRPCRDGENNNLSWNCGEEGETTHPSVTRLRARQMRNLAAALLLAHGVPMIQMGDEYGHSKVGRHCCGFCSFACQQNRCTAWRLRLCWLMECPSFKWGTSTGTAWWTGKCSA